MNRYSKGAALIIVLFIATILGVVSVLLIAKTKYHIQRLTIAKDYMQAERLLLSDLNHLIFEIQTSPYIILGNTTFLPNNAFSDNGALPKNINLHGAPFKFRSLQVNIQDMGGLLPIIPLDRTLFMRYLTSINWPQEQIYYFLDVLADWQDNDGFQRINGAESSAYGVFGYPLNQPLQSVKDVALFAKVSPLLINALAVDANVIQVGVGQSLIDYAPDQLLGVVNTEFDGKSIQKERDKSRQQGNVSATSSYPSGNWIIHVESRYQEAKVTKDIHVLRRFGELRPFVITD